MAERLRAGVVWANTFNRFDPARPFGGYKESGFGREGGRHGLEPYLTFPEKPVIERWMSTGREQGARPALRPTGLGARRDVADEVFGGVRPADFPR